MAHVNSNNATHHIMCPPVSSRRRFLSTAVGIAAGCTAVVATPVLALPATADADAQRLWAARLQHCDRLRAVIPLWEEAREKLPAWAKPGHRCVDHEGNPCDREVNWRWIRPLSRKPDFQALGDLSAPPHTTSKIITNFGSAFSAKATRLPLPLSALAPRGIGASRN